MASPKHELQEPFTDMHRKNLDAAMHLAQITLENAQRIAELQTEAARAIFDDTLRGMRAMAEAKDTRAAMETRNQLAQSCGEHLLESTRKIAELATSAQSEIGRTLNEQMASASGDMVAMMNRMVQSLPLPATDTMNIMQSTLDSTRGAMEQMTRATQEALSSLTNFTTRAAGAATKTATAIVEPFTPRVATLEKEATMPAVAAGGKKAKHE